MNILLLPNSLKGSLSAHQTVRVLQRVLSPRHTLRAFPLSDGGDGFMDFFATLHPHTSQRIYLCAENAFGEKKRTSYLWISAAKTAVIETARVCGLGCIKSTDLKPLAASSFGVGQVICHALSKGAKKIYIGLGGVACNDGGAGIAQALGAQLTDKRGREITHGAKPLLQLHTADITALQKNLRAVKIYAVADVKNPLLGPHGSARVYGPQKGATAAQVRLLERALSVYAQVVQKTTGKNIASTPGTAAAGGLCAGLYGLCGAEIIFGADFLKTHLPLDKWARWADLIITCEGKLDVQTLYGKAPLAALAAAARAHKPALFICGSYEKKVLKKLPCGLQLQLACLNDFAADPKDSILHAAKYIQKITCSCL